MLKKRQVVKTISPCSVRQSKSSLKYFFVPKFLPFHCICVKIKSLIEIGINELLQKRLSVGGISLLIIKEKVLEKTFAVGIIMKILRFTNITTFFGNKLLRFEPKTQKPQNFLPQTLSYFKVG